MIDHFNSILKAFKINAKCVNFKMSKNIHSYDIELFPGEKIDKIKKYAPEISLSLKQKSNPFISVLSDLGLIRLEFSSNIQNNISLFELPINNRPNGKLNCLLGEDSYGNPIWMDLTENPHTLISGTTNSGKSTLLHNIIANLLFYNNVNLFLFDPKSIEFNKYKAKNISISYSYDECSLVLNKLCNYMDLIYDKIKSGYNICNFPYSVLIIDEFADLIMQDKNNSFHNNLCRLAQKGRAAGIHIILATQRPSHKILNGDIKANFPAVIACKVANSIDSRVVIGSSGAEDLAGKGDALIKNINFNLKRFQIAFTNPDITIKALSL